MIWYWLSGAFLVGLIGLAVPLILHWLQRKPKNPVDFPAFDFLLRMPQRHRRTNNWRKWLVLLLRMAAIILVVAAFCRPYQSGRAPELKTARVLLWDDSASLATERHGEELRNRLWRELDQVAPAYPAVIGLVRENGRIVWSGELSGDRAALRDWFTANRRNQGAAHFAGVPPRVDFLLKNWNAPRREVVIFSDDQALSWQGLERGMTIAEADLARWECTGVAANDLSLRAPRVALTPAPVTGGGGTLQVECDLVNTGTRPVISLRLSAGTVAGAYDERTETGLAPGEIRRVRLTLAAGTEPVAAGWIQLHGVDEFTLDDTLYFASDPVRRSQLWVAPSAAGGFDFTALALGVVPAAETPWDWTAPAAGRLVFWPDATTLTAAQRQRLKEFVEAGGTLALNLAAGNPELSAWLEGWGVKLSPRRGAVEATCRFGSFDFTHPALAGMADWSLNGWFDVLFFRSCQAELPPGARVLAAFDDGRAAVAEVSAGRGKLLLIFTEFVPAAGNWPTHYSFLPFWREIAAYYTRQSRPVEWFAVGDAVPPGGGAPLELWSRDGKWHETAAARFDRAGIYRRQAAGGTQWWAVNQPDAELDFTALTRRPELTAGPVHRDAGAALPVEPGHHAEIFQWLLLLALGCWLGELALANRTAL